MSLGSGGYPAAVATRELILVRHAESSGNVARQRAEASGAEVIGLEVRDPDVPLSDLGRRQAAALGRYLAGLAPDRAPQAVWCSPYLRARQTADIATAALDLPIRHDERLRDRELGILDMLTGRGVAARFPAEAQRRRWLGKFAYRPPGGESWADVALRLRGVLGDIERAPTERLLIVAHDAVVLLVRYICELLDEAQLLTIAASTTIGNAAVTRLVRADAGAWTLAEFNAVTHLEDEPVQTEPPTHRDALRS